MATEPSHRNEQTGQPGLDRIQANVRSLIEFVKSLAWLSQRAYVALATNVSINAAAYAALISTTITTARARGYIVCHLTASGVEVTNAGTVYFQILVDTVVAKGVWSTVGAGAAFSTALVVRVPVVAGLHTVAVQWKSSVNGARINAATAVEEHANLSIHEEAS